MPDPDPTASPGLRVVIGDDDLVLTRILQHILQAYGHRDVRTSSTLGDGLALAEEADLVLLDHQLPDGDGIEAVPQFLSRPDPPSGIVVTTSLLRTEGFEPVACRNLAELERGLAAPGTGLVVLGPPAGLGDADPLMGLQPSPDHSWTLVLLTRDMVGGAVLPGVDLLVPLPFDPTTFGSEVVNAVRP